VLEFAERLDDEIQFESARSMGPDEFARWVEARPASDINHYELLNGRVVMTPPAGYPHGEIGGALQFVLSSHVRPRGLGKVFDSSQGFRLPTGDTVEPDHSLVSNERWTAMGAPVRGEFLRVVPDLLVEVLSRSTRSRDRGEKKGIYERNGAREYRLVDPVAGEITVFVARDGRFGEGRVYGDGERVRSEILEGLEEDVATLVAGGQDGVPSET
jgi:Uma2 family endonuclease